MDNQSINNYRYERKFAVSHLTFHEVERIVKLNRAMFFPIYSPRYINNIYFDTDRMDHYEATIEGAGNREKFRLRWYGNLFSNNLENSQLEIKIKKNYLNTKKTFRLMTGSVDSYRPEKIVSDILNCSDVSMEATTRLKQMKPILLNRYYRKYFLSADGSFRLTIDTDIQYMNTDSRNLILQKGKDSRRKIIVELKYGVDKDHPARHIASTFPFRMTRNSKYTNGIDTLMRRGYL